MKEVTKMMDEFLTAISTVEEVYPKVKEMSTGGFMAMIGVIVDQYAADHGIPSKELHKMLCEVSQQVFDELGEMQKTGGMTS